MERAKPRAQVSKERQMVDRSGCSDGLLSVSSFSSQGSCPPLRRRHGRCADACGEMGMGTATVQIQHAADRLGLPLDRVAFHYGDSSLPDTPVMAGGSNQTATIFAAVQAAVEEVHKELLKLAQKSPDSPLAGAKFDGSKLETAGCFDRRTTPGRDLRCHSTGARDRASVRSGDGIRTADGNDEVLDGFLWSAILRSPRA